MGGLVNTVEGLVDGLIKDLQPTVNEINKLLGNLLELDGVDAVQLNAVQKLISAVLVSVQDLLYGILYTGKVDLPLKDVIDALNELLKPVYKLLGNVAGPNAEAAVKYIVNQIGKLLQNIVGYVQKLLNNLLSNGLLQNTLGTATGLLGDLSL